MLNVADRKVIRRARFPEAGSVTEDSIRIELAVTESGFNSKMMRYVSQSKTTLEFMKSRYQRGTLI